MLKTMPRARMKALRFLVERILSSITRWEDQHADPDDYRMRSVSGGLHQASQSLKDLIEGKFNPLHDAVDRLERQDDGEADEAYVRGLFNDAVIPLQLRRHDV